MNASITERPTSSTIRRSTDPSSSTPRCASTFLHGKRDKFLQSMKDAIAEDASAEHVDDFLDGFDGLFNLPVVFH